jgi:hypothetical protein
MLSSVRLPNIRVHSAQPVADSGGGSRSLLSERYKFAGEQNGVPLRTPTEGEVSTGKGNTHLIYFIGEIDEQLLNALPPARPL